MDVLGRTFEEVRAALQPRQHEVKPLRAGYRRLLLGQPGCAPLRADVLPVVRTQRTGQTVKFVQRTGDDLEIESVVVPMQRRQLAWQTVCVSSQVGCARGCVYCQTAQMGLLRNLTAAEIVGQVVAAQRDFQQRIRNVVFMGMGEPFDNFEAVVQAIRVLTDGSGLSFGGERISISTVGRVAGIRKLAALGWRRVNLAISLSAPNDELRAQLMPGIAHEPLAELRAALLAYPRRNCQFFMIEYVLIPGVNDARDHARELADYLAPVPSVVNVIPYNPRAGSPWPAPSEAGVVQFLAWLKEAGQMCKRRLTKGREGMAACGQLGNPQLVQPRPSSPLPPH